MLMNTPIIDSLIKQLWWEDVMDFAMEHLMAFVQEKWWIILIAAVVMVIIIKVVKAIVKWLLVAAIIAGLVLYGLNYEPIREAVDSVAEYSLDAAFQAMTGEAEDAEYTIEEDGSFTVVSKSIKITGAIGSDKVTVYFHGVKLGEVTITDAIRSYIETAQGASR